MQNDMLTQCNLMKAEVDAMLALGAKADVEKMKEVQNRLEPKSTGNRRRRRVELSGSFADRTSLVG